MKTQMSGSRPGKALASAFLGLTLLLGPSALTAAAQQPAAPDPAAALVAADPDGQRWLQTLRWSQDASLGPKERLDGLLPWAERYHVSVPVLFEGVPNRTEARRDELELTRTASMLAEAIDDAVRRSVASKGWRPMGELGPWEEFLARQGFRLVEEQPDSYIIGARQRFYRRPPKLPQAVHTCIIMTRDARPRAVYGIKLRYTYPPDVAGRIEALEGSAKDYRGALALRLPAFQADRALFEALGQTALGPGWPALRERWLEFIDYVSAPSHVASRAQVLEKKNPPTISEVRLIGELAAHLYEIGPSGRLELLPQTNALDLRGNPLYGARIEAR